MIKMHKLLTSIILGWGLLFIPEAALSTDAGIPQEGMVYVPSGKFIMGSGPEDGRAGYDYGVDEEPRHEVDLKGFYIDVRETTIGEYRIFLRATGRGWIGDRSFSALYPDLSPGEEALIQDYPVTYVTWHDADAYCRWKGKRLPAEEEWEKAARGAQGLRYPWGDSYGTKEVDPLKDNVLSFRPAGSVPYDRSPYGALSMAGNVAEWTASHYLPYPGNRLNDGRWSDFNYVVRGGSFILNGPFDARPAVRSFAYPDFDHRAIGFRCAKDTGS